MKSLPESPNYWGTFTVNMFVTHVKHWDLGKAKMQ